MAKLVIYLGETLHREVELGPRTFRIGRADENDIVLSDPERSVSRNHAELRFENGRYTIVDLGSANGIWVADQQVKQAQVELGVPIEVGTYRLVLVASPADAPAAPAKVETSRPAPPVPKPPKPEAAKAKTEPARPAPVPEAPPPAPAKSEPPKPAAAKPTVPKRRDKKRRTWWYAAAAVLVLGAATAGLYLRQSGERTPADTADRTVAPPVQPSGGVTPPSETPTEPATSATQPAKAPEATAPKLPTVSRSSKTAAPPPREKPAATASVKKPAVVPPPVKPPVKPPAAAVVDQQPAAVTTRPAKTAPQIPTDPKARARELQRIYQASREAIIKGEYLAAIAGFETVLKAEPGYLDAKEMLGIARGGAKNAAQLEVDYGTKAEMEGDWAGAIKRFERALVLDPTATSPVDGIKRVHARMQIEGEELFKRARQLDAADRGADAIAMYEKALQLLPADHPNAKVAVERIAQLRKDT